MNRPRERMNGGLDSKKRESIRRARAFWKATQIASGIPAGD
jgi:hypothetical protein